jgi:ABC-type amino acid transport system permease subunit
VSSLLGIVSTFRGITESKATGIAIVPSGLAEAALSPVFWILATLSCVFFFWSGGRDSPLLRVLLFWIPSSLICLPRLGISALIAYAFFQSKRG